MSDTILVAYATRADATAGVAEAIGQRLTDGGVPVEVRRMAEVTDLTPSRAVVAGSAINGGEVAARGDAVRASPSGDIGRQAVRCPEQIQLIHKTAVLEVFDHRTASWQLSTLWQVVV